MLRLLAEVAAGWVNKPPPQERRKLQLFPTAPALLPPRDGYLGTICTTTPTARSPTTELLCRLSFRPSVFAPPSFTHTHLRQLVLFTAGCTSLSTPRNNFAESHGVIRILMTGWLNRNTRRFLEPPMIDQRPNQIWRWKERGLDFWGETFTDFFGLGDTNTVFICVASVCFCHSSWVKIWCILILRVCVK